MQTALVVIEGKRYSITAEKAFLWPLHVRLPATQGDIRHVYVQRTEGGAWIDVTFANTEVLTRVYNAVLAQGANSTDVVQVWLLIHSGILALPVDEGEQGDVVLYRFIGLKESGDIEYAGQWPFAQAKALLGGRIRAFGVAEASNELAGLWLVPSS